MSAAWGETSSSGNWEPTSAEWQAAGPKTVTDGVSVMLNNQVFRWLTHHPVVVAAIQARAQQIADRANELAEWNGAEYIVVTNNDPDTTRARCYVKPGNMAAILDDEMNATLLKAHQSIPSDPIGGDGT